MMYISIDHPDASSRTEVEGEWVDVKGTRFKLKAPGDGNAEFVLHMVANRAKMQDGESASSYISREMPKLLVDSLVTDWELKADGEPVPFDQAEAIFGQHPKLAQDVYFAAMELLSEDADALEADSEQLGESPGGGPITGTRPAA